jgi:hypothetical protein
MEDLNLYNNLYNENYTDTRKDEIIQKVFENKINSMLSDNSKTIKMAKGGVVKPQKIYTPYEFLHELLPEVYGRPYVVSDEVGKQYNLQIEKEENELQEFVDSKLAEYNTYSIYQLNDKTLIEEIEIKRRKLISDKAFITTSELEAYLFCNPQLDFKHYVKEMPIYDVVSMINQNLIMIDYDSVNDSYKYVYVYDYLSGNVYKKRSVLFYKKERLFELGALDEAQFEKQIKAIDKSLPTQATITKSIETCMFVLPSSDFGTSFIIKPDDLVDMFISKSESFKGVFKTWTVTEMDKSLLRESDTIDNVHLFFTDMTSKKGMNLDEYMDKRKRAYSDGKRMLVSFLNDGLSTYCQTRLQIEWNEKYNNFAEAKYYKFPVACQLSNKFKNGRDFTPNETQIQSVQFTKNVGSGLLAYGVGVGKTASSIIDVSYALDNNLCKKPLFIVPNATYEKWKMEMFGGQKTSYEVDYIENGEQLTLFFESLTKAEKFAKAVNGIIKSKQEDIYGHIPHVPYVELGNLNESMVRSIKDYSDLDFQKMAETNALIEYLKEIPSEYIFDDEVINQYIFNLYTETNLYGIRERYDEFVDYIGKSNVPSFNNWNKKGKESNLYYYDERRQFYIDNVLKVTLKDFLFLQVRNLKEELPYTLGEIKQYKDGTIFIATLQALKHIGLLGMDYKDDSSLQGKMFREWTQGDYVSQGNQYAKTSDYSMWKEAVYGRIRTKVDISRLGTDFVVFDESHFLKKVYTDSKGRPKGGTRGGSGSSLRYERHYSFGESEKSSTIALAGYFVTRYIQMNNNDKNVIHLTATPFTNKPAEIYSMLCLTNRKMVVDNNMTYMEQFFDNYMDISFDLAITNKGIERKEMLLGYKNLPQLRNLIYSMMDYKSGEDANIKRPEKILFPSAENKRETTIPETEIQDKLFKQIKDYQRGKISYEEMCADNVEATDIDEMTEDELLQVIMDNGTDAQKEKYEEVEQPLDEETFEELKKDASKILEKKVRINENDITNEEDKNKFRVLQGIGLLKAVTLSPYLSTCNKEEQVEPTYRQYIETSPKLLYTIQCIKSIHDYELENNLLKSGCIIYMNLGVNVSYKTATGTFKWKESGFEKIKQYLINVMGYDAEELSLVSGGLSAIEKERAKNKFLSGRSSVLIGSSTISTGVDLQDNASALFICSFDWNPTDAEQISGRIHRQGNRFEKIRIAYPMIMNSTDPSIFQQLYEKTLRIKNIWDRNDKGNTLDVKDFDVDTLRKGILDDPEDLATYSIEFEKQELITQQNILVNRKIELNTASYNQDVLEKFTPQMKGIIVVLDAYKKDKARNELKLRIKEKIGDAQEEYDDKLGELKYKFDEDEIEAEKYKEELKKIKEKLEKEKEKAGKDIYDFQTDPEGRYTYLTYDELEDLNKVNDLLSKWVTNEASYFRKIINERDSNPDTHFIWNGSEVPEEFGEGFRDENGNRIGWLQKTFPRFHKGLWDLSKTEEEDYSMYIDFDSQTPVSNATSWKNAYKGFYKLKEKLRRDNISLDNVEGAFEIINNRLIDIESRLQVLPTIYDEKLAEYTLAKQERRVIQTSLEQRVFEFAEYNPILHEVVETFEEDRARFVETPLETIPEIKPKKKTKEQIEEIIEEAVIEEEEIEEAEIEEAEIQEEKLVDTTNLIENLKNGMIARFSFPTDKKGKNEVIDLLFENGDFIQYRVIEDSKGNLSDEQEEEISESQVIDFYVANNDNLLEEFFDDGTEEEEIDILDVTLPSGFYVKISPRYTATVRNLNSFKDYLEREDELFGEEFGEIREVDKSASEEWVDMLNQIIQNKKDEIQQPAQASSDVKLKDWYIKNYPTDELGESINGVNTFEDLWYGIHNNIDVYEIIGFGDSILRERLFEHLAEIKGVNYYYVYDKWLGRDYVERDELRIDESIENEEVSKAELYNQLIEGYELALELETDEEKIKMYNDLIEGYQLALELEN